jgi:hypothetical protein
MRSRAEVAKSDTRRERYERFLKGRAKQQSVEKTEEVIPDLKKAVQYLKNVQTQGGEDGTPDLIC